MASISMRWPVSFPWSRVTDISQTQFACLRYETTFASKLIHFTGTGSDCQPPLLSNPENPKTCGKDIRKIRLSLPWFVTHWKCDVCFIAGAGTCALDRHDLRYGEPSILFQLTRSTTVQGAIGALYRCKCVSFT
jgi:hypothetical protein